MSSFFLYHFFLYLHPAFSFGNSSPAQVLLLEDMTVYTCFVLFCFLLIKVSPNYRLWIFFLVDQHSSDGFLKFICFKRHNFFNTCTNICKKDKRKETEYHTIPNDYIFNTK